MTQSREYLAVLSKVMREDRTQPDLDRESYDSLYAIVHSELNARLRDSLYPAAPALTQKMERMLLDMESLFICPEMIGKACLLLSGYRTNVPFYALGGTFLDTRFTRWLSNIPTQIPFVVVHGDANGIEVLNYADQRIPLPPVEYQLLITQSGQNRVALNKIVQAFIIHTPLKRENACLIFDNIYRTAGRIFGRAVCKQVIHINRTGLENIQKRGLPHCDAVTCDAGMEKELSQIIASRRCTLIKRGKLADYLNDHVSPILYGFRDEFRAIQIRIESYYLNAARQAKATAQEIVGDIVRLGDKKDGILPEIQTKAQARAKAFEGEYKKIRDILTRTAACVIAVENALHDVVGPEKTVPRRVYDDVFTGLFAAGENSARFGREVLSRLTTLGYDDCELVTAYIQSISGQTPRIPCAPIKAGEWEKAKMYLAVANFDHLSAQLLEDYLAAIDASRIVTGKEYYAKSLASTGKAKIFALKESFVRGYEPAGAALLARYKEGDRRDDLLRTLSNALVPEACMMMADQSESEEADRRRYANLSDRQFTYYKIAAAREYLPAIGAIVERVYQSRFAQVYQLHGEQLRDPRFHTMIENGKVLCQLCRFLIDKMYQVNHFSEILGVVLFCLNTNLSEAMTLLSGIDTGAANYCKGGLYEFGGGVSIDIDQAVIHYRRALELGFSPVQTQRRLDVCLKRKRDNEAQKTSAKSYQADKSYRAETSPYATSSSWCVITTAACQSLNAADDCEELQLLRWFRDTHLQGTAEGESIVREYYRVGPLITGSIANTADPVGIYRSLWDEYIAPSCAAIRAEQWDAARSVYVQMVKMLCERFGIDIRPQVREALKEWNVEAVKTASVEEAQCPAGESGK